MRHKTIIATALTTLILSACGVNNNNNMDDTASRNRNTTEPVRVHDTNHTNNLNDREPLLQVRNNERNENTKPRMRIADKAADKIAAMPEVKDVNVIVTEDNAYVAAQLTDGVELTRIVERKIADQVKSVDQSINDVYVSANVDFYDRMTSYSNDLENGEPVEGLMEEFSDTVRRIFPTNTENNR